MQELFDEPLQQNYLYQALVPFRMGTHSSPHLVADIAD
jgi:hypothetical protein